MKKIVRNILAVAVMLGTYTSYASQEASTLPASYNINNHHIIKITDAKGEVIFSGQLNQTGKLTEFFDFTQLKDGLYQVEITKAYEIEINSVEVKNHVVTFIESAKEKIFKPVIRTENAKVMISKLALDSKEMTVELYFEDDLFYSETLKGEKVLNRIYQLDQDLPGNYTAIIRSDNRVYVEHFSI
ncbi:hypothetical protein [Winogradskyella tangerina]|uniref:hypothetical protein n=1 Tax=Winogradskyella tangerina TaxID=2023240 RepID=UPI000DBE0692|nr:hypothetical protein [Winogradskyella tangerina]